MLSDWGANVIRIEPPPKHDRGSVTGKRRGSDEQNMHREKRSICIDLKSDEGREILQRLVLKSDVVVENFRADVKERLGLSYEHLSAIKPDIILASISGFGQTGPYSDRPCVDQVMQGMCGLMSVTGDKDGTPMRAGIAVSDTTAGMFLGQGILLALLHRERTGHGQWVHTSLLEAMLNKLDFLASRYTVDSEVPTRAGNNHPTLVPMGTYEASDGYVNIAASTDRMWKQLCEELGAPSLSQRTEFADRTSRYENRDMLARELGALIRTRSVADLTAGLNARGVPCGPVFDIAQAFENPQARHVHMTRSADHPALGTLELIRSPINLSLFPHPERFSTHAPDPGEQTREILYELGLDNADIDILLEKEICC